MSINGSDDKVHHRRILLDNNTALQSINYREAEYIIHRLRICNHYIERTILVVCLNPYRTHKDDSVALLDDNGIYFFECDEGGKGVCAMCM